MMSLLQVHSEGNSMLTLQCRMQPLIMECSKRILYHDLIRAHPSVADRTLADLEVRGYKLPSPSRTTLVYRHLSFHISLTLQFLYTSKAHPQRPTLS